MAIGRKDIDAARDRREKLGRRASYGRLAAMTGFAKSTVFVVLNNQESAMPIDRERVLRAVNAAMDEIEKEDEGNGQTAGGTVTAEPIP